MDFISAFKGNEAYGFAAPPAATRQEEGSDAAIKQEQAVEEALARREKEDRFEKDYAWDRENQMLIYAAKRAEAGNGSVPSLKGRFRVSYSGANTAQLQARLRAATTGVGVRGVITSAMRAISAYKLAASLDDRYRSCNTSGEIARLERIVQNAGSKIKSLDEEELMEAQRKKAELRRSHKKALRIKQELSRKRAARGARENFDVARNGVGAGILCGRRSEEEYRLSQETADAVAQLEAELAAELTGQEGIAAELAASGETAGAVAGGASPEAAASGEVAAASVDVSA